MASTIRPEPCLDRPVSASSEISTFHDLGFAAQSPLSRIIRVCLEC